VGSLPDEMILHFDAPMCSGNAHMNAMQPGWKDAVVQKVYDISGKLIKSCDQGFREPGIHSIDIDGTGFDTGMYYYTLQGKISGNQPGKMLVILYQFYRVRL
jgi:hypothetical protein